jgi:basic membrane lipoprotein Med (substrate-binding protein (PBP1-ABC) superfamily)
MSKKSFILVLVTVLMITSLIAGCAGGATTSTGGKVKVFGAYATPIEEPWDGVIHQALQKAKDDGLIDYTYTENIGYSGDMERVLREVAEQQKPDLIVGDAFGNEEAVRKVAADYPKIAFAFGSELGPVAPNLAVFDNWIHEPAYLCGMLAGGLTKTNTIGVVAAVPIPEVNRLVNAFIAGAKETNPEVKVLVSFIGEFFNPATAKEQALAHIEAGADVLFGERAGVIEAAAEKGIYAFGNMSDQNEIAPQYVVSSPVWNMTPTVEYLFTQVKAGTFTSMDLKDFSMMAKGGATLAPYHDLDSKIPADLKQKITEKEAAIKSGTFRVPIDEAAPAAVN